jgi:tight adherence protein B
MLFRSVSYLCFFGFVVIITLIVVKLVRSYRQRFISQTEEKVGALYLTVAPEQLWLMTILGTIGGALILAIVSGFNLLMIALGAAGGFLAPRLYLRRLEQQRLKKFDLQLVDALTLVANSLKAGMSLLQAIEMVTREMGPPIKQEFAYVLQENRVGKPIPQALTDMMNRIPSEDLAITVNAMNTAQETGGALSEVFLSIADTIRERNEIRGRVETLTSQGRLQGIVMSLLPWALAGLMYLLDPTMMRPMFNQTLGQIMLGAVVLLEIAGWLLIRRIVAIDI